MGVDSMIHLVTRARALAGSQDPSPWRTARSQMAAPILAATLIICAGFGIFALSTFPPTQRFGLAVILGTVAAATMALIGLPLAAQRPAPETVEVAPAAP
jgi:predicted RND superfamily exporter protein